MANLCLNFRIMFKFLTQAPFVQRVDNAIHRISVGKTNYAIHWIVIYPVDSVIHPLSNWGLNFKLERGINTICLLCQRGHVFWRKNIISERVFQQFCKWLFPVRETVVENNVIIASCLLAAAFFSYKQIKYP